MKRVGFGILWFVVLWIGASAIGGGIAGAVASHASPDVANAKTASERYSRGSDVGRVAGKEFDRKYGSLILSGSLLVSIIGTATSTLPGTRRKVPPAARNSNSLDVNVHQDRRSTSLDDTIRALKKLRDQGILSEQEYQQKVDKAVKDAQ